MSHKTPLYRTRHRYIATDMCRYVATDMCRYIAQDSPGQPHGCQPAPPNTPSLVFPSVCPWSCLFVPIGVCASAVASVCKLESSVCKLECEWSQVYASWSASGVKCMQVGVRVEWQVDATCSETQSCHTSGKAKGSQPAQQQAHIGGGWQRQRDLR